MGPAVLRTPKKITEPSHIPDTALGSLLLGFISSHSLVLTLLSGGCLRLFNTQNFTVLMTSACYAC